MYRLLSLFILLLSIHCSNAIADVQGITLTNDTTTEHVNPHSAIYESKVTTYNANDLRLNRNFLPYKTTTNSNLGVSENNVWYYFPITNASDLKEWVISIRFSQIKLADLYIYEDGELTFSQSDGNSNKSSQHAIPTFKVDIESGTTVEVFLNVEASSLSLIAPIYISSQSTHQQVNQIDFLLWGMFYGAIFVLGIYGTFYSVSNHSFKNLLVFFHLFIILTWQFKWSGHINLIDANWLSFMYQVDPQEILLLLCFSSSIFTFFLIDKQFHGRYSRINLFATSCFSFMLLLPFGLDWFSNKVMFYFIHGWGIYVLVLNLWVVYNALIRRFYPARSLMFGWVVLLLGSVISTLYITNALPTSSFNAQLYQFTLILQAGTFLYAIVVNNQYQLKEEVTQARSDLENNYIIIEEKNVMLDLSRKDAVKAAEVKAQFLANMSHEIRTPLNAIVGFSRELEKNIESSERDEHVKIINSSANDLLTIVNDILDFSKMEAGQLSINERPFNPKEIFEDVAAHMSKSAHLKQLEFLYDIDITSELLIGDSFKVKQLLNNLLSNALKFTNDGHIGLQVNTKFDTRVETTLEITVIDSGIGISSEDMNKIFKAFHQLDDELNRSYQGTGLGLVICQELVNLMGGKIDVDSAPGVGSNFVITLPFKKEGTTPLGADQKIAKDVKALVVDSWAPSRRNTVKLLQQAGFNVWSYENIESMTPHISKDDYVFISLPQKQIQKRAKVLGQLRNSHPCAIVLLYSGPEPNHQLFGNLNTSPYLIRQPITLRKLDALNAPSSKTHENMKTPDVFSLPAIRLLAVDDMELNLKLLTTWLENSAVTIETAMSGEMALQMCEQVEYDMILMDIQMPNMDGITASQHIRKTTYNIGTPIIAVTAHALNEEKSHFLNNGMDDFLSKPVRLDDLIQLINNWCEPGVSNAIPRQNEQESTKLIDQNSLINWQLAVKKSNNNHELAVEFATDFFAHVAVQNRELKDIHSNYTIQKNNELLPLIHKIHGACHYTGVPPLTKLCEMLETSLKTSPEGSHQALLQKVIETIDNSVQEWESIKVSV